MPLLYLITGNAHVFMAFSVFPELSFDFSIAFNLFMYCFLIFSFISWRFIFSPSGCWQVHISLFQTPSWCHLRQFLLSLLPAVTTGSSWIGWPVSCKGDIADIMGEFPEAISTGACIWFTLLYFTFCGRASRKIGIWLTEFIKNLKLYAEQTKEFLVYNVRQIVGSR